MPTGLLGRGLKNAKLITNSERGVWALAPEGSKTTKVDEKKLAKDVHEKTRGKRPCGQTSDDEAEDHCVCYWRDRMPIADLETRREDYNISTPVPSTALPGRYEAALVAHPDYGCLSPFANWDANKSTATLPWYDAYNATKHDREEELPKGTLHNVISALAAVQIMSVAQFGFGEQGRGRFQADAFPFAPQPEWLSDGYIRPLALSDEPDEAWKKATWREEAFEFDASPKG